MFPSFCFPRSFSSRAKKPDLINSTRGDGLSALHIGANNGSFKLCRLLLERGFDQSKIDAPEMHGATALWIACQQGSLKVVKLLLEAGANPQAERSDGIPPIFIAAQEGHADVVEALIAANAQLEFARGTNGATPLYISAQKGHLQVVQVLLRHGANPDVKVDKITPLEVAVHHGHTQCAAALVRTGIPVKLSVDAVPAEPAGEAMKSLNKAHHLVVETLHANPVRSNSLPGSPEAEKLITESFKVKKKDLAKLSKKELQEKYKASLKALTKAEKELHHARNALRKEQKILLTEVNGWKHAYMVLEETALLDPVDKIDPEESSSHSHKEHII